MRAKPARGEFEFRRAKSLEGRDKFIQRKQQQTQQRQVGVNNKSNEELQDSIAVATQKPRKQKESQDLLW